jgi:GNAT superfamily N-acetyltransferase
VLGIEDLRVAAPMLAHAFHDDPLTAYLVPDRSARTVALPLLYDISLRLAMRCGEVAVPRLEITGLAAWLPPGAVVTAADVAAVGGRKAIGLLGAAGSRRLEEITAAFAATRAGLAPEPHWYLSILAADPGHQRGGVGGALLGRLLALVASAPAAVYLETANVANLPFYEAHGFCAPGPARTPGGLDYWPMLRPTP